MPLSSKIPHVQIIPMVTFKNYVTLRRGEGVWLSVTHSDKGEGRGYIGVMSCSVIFSLAQSVIVISIANQSLLRYTHTHLFQSSMQLITYHRPAVTSDIMIWNSHWQQIINYQWQQIINYKICIMWCSTVVAFSLTDFTDVDNIHCVTDVYYVSLIGENHEGVSLKGGLSWVRHNSWRGVAEGDRGEGLKSTKKAWCNLWMVPNLSQSSALPVRGRIRSYCSFDKLNMELLWIFLVTD